MKARIILQRRIQPPIDTQSGTEIKTWDIDIPQDIYDWVMGEDCKSCNVWSNAIGLEILKP